MLITAALHTALMQIEARREEKYMLRAHGETYRDYLKSVGRFVSQVPMSVYFGTFQPSPLRFRLNS